MYTLISAVSSMQILWIISMCFLPALIYMLYTGIKVKATFRKYANVNSKQGYTARQVVEMMLNESGVEGVSIGRVSGNLSDHFDPRSNTINLSDSTYNSTSVAAIGVAAHEAGHAIQYAENYAMLKVRGVIVPVIGVMSKMVMPLFLLTILVEMFLGYDNPISNLFLFGSVIIYAVYMVFSLVTLPVEFNASNRAKKFLSESNIMDAEESHAVKSVLSAAANTYVASFLLSFIQFCRLLFIFLSRRNRN